MIKWLCDLIHRIDGHAWILVCSDEWREANASTRSFVPKNQACIVCGRADLAFERYKREALGETDEQKAARLVTEAIARAFQGEPGSLSLPQTEVGHLSGAGL